MLALPALDANGLFKSLDMFDFKEKYYRIVDISQELILLINSIVYLLASGVA